MAVWTIYLIYILIIFGVLFFTTILPGIIALCIISHIKKNKRKQLKEN